jgi:CubicO group peptidase (beta-lactamase class C family)
MQGGLASGSAKLGFDGIFGWGGWGGSLFQMSLQHNISFAYTMTAMGHHLLGDERHITVSYLSNLDY